MVLLYVNNLSLIRVKYLSVVNVNSAISTITVINPKNPKEPKTATFDYTYDNK